MTFPATRADALARLEEFLPYAGRAYASTRNNDTGPGPRSNVSMLSPAIRRRLITEAEVCARVVAAHGYTAAEKFIQEVCWRTYWKGWLEARPEIWTRYLGHVAKLTARLETDTAMRQAYAQATSGNTGIDAFDAWVTELTTTGYLHNHARMNFASIWVFTLGLPWQLGADFFYWHLLDADPAANTLSWRWVAGLQTVGKAYGASADNIRRRSGGRFTVAAPLAEHPAARPADRIPPPRPLAPAGVPDTALRTGLFVSTDDLAVEQLALPSIGAVAATSRLPDSVAGSKRQHVDLALDDGVMRAARHFGVPPDRTPETQGIDGVRDWAARHRLQQLITADVPRGPVADRLDAMAAALAPDGVQLVRLRRDWDTVAWPHASKGFFNFRSVIPKLLTLT